MLNLHCRKNVYTNDDNDNVVPLVKTKQFTKKPESNALEFKQKILYRSENKRMSSANSLSLRKKRLQSKTCDVAFQRG